MRPHGAENEVAREASNKSPFSSRTRTRAKLGPLLLTMGVVLLSARHYTTPRPQGVVSAGWLAGDLTSSEQQMIAQPRRQLQMTLRSMGGRLTGVSDTAVAPSPLWGGGGVSQPSPEPVQSCAVQNVSCRAVACKNLPRRRPRSIPLVKLGFPLHMTARVPRPMRFEDVFTDATHAAGFPTTIKRLLPSTPRALIQGHSFRSCAVVGSSGNLNLASYGEEIDAHQVVFRMNKAPTRGHETHTGTKTHFRLLNARWTFQYASGRSLTLEKGVVLIASRGSQLTRNFEQLTRFMRSKRPDVRTTLLQHSALSRTRALLGAFKRCAAAGGTKYRGGVVPTSGLVLIFNLKDICGKISVYGFGHEKMGGKMSDYHYYTSATSRKHGNPTHSFAAELDLIHALARGDHIRFCDADSCIGTGTNKQ
mmetsp:Transcript_15513/g.40116  ORF Transcript_15513/g.40116 Transcript_15513/m.40116 type:complete len:420 (-) Transcript_15513:99-1358(-)